MKAFITISALVLFMTLAPFCKAHATDTQTPQNIQDIVVHERRADTAQLSTVTGFKASGIKTDRVTLKWKPIDDAQGYIIYQYDLSKNKWIRKALVSSSSAQYTVAGLSSAVTYYFSIKGYRIEDNKEILSAFHPNIYCTTKPDKVSGLKCKKATAHTVTLKWNKAARASGYYVYKYNASLKKWDEIKQVSSKKNTVLVSGLDPATEYRFAVRSYKDGKVKRMLSSQKNMHCTTSPEKVKGVKRGKVTASSVTIKWGKVSKASGYAMYRYDTGSKKWKYIKAVSASKNKYTFKGLSSAKKYRFAVRSYIKASGKRVYNKSKSSISCTTAPANVSGFMQSDITAGSVTLQWQKTKRATGYIIYRYDGSNKKWVRLKKVTGTSATINGYGYDYGKPVKFGIKAYKKSSDASERKSLKRKTIITNTLIKLKGQLEQMVSGYKGDWSIYVKNLDTNEYILINDKSMCAASTIKLFCMAATYERIEQGWLSESYVYDLLYSMITVSSNQSYNSLLKMNVVGFTDKWIADNGFNDTKQVNGLEPSTNDYGLSTGYGPNMTSAKDCGRLLEQIYRGECVSKSASAKMLALLKKQQVRNKIPSGVPSGVVVANKTGETDDESHDTAIVFSKGADYILCIFASTYGDG